MRRLGKYTLVTPIASGGMAEVWRAEVAGPAGFVKQVALKLVRADRGDDDEMVRMFIQEARLASALHHAGIVHVFDFNHVDGRYLIAMELVHGKTLRAVLDRCRERGVRFGLARSLQVAVAVARALAYAHRPLGDGGAAGLVHRDVSPHNVLVSFEGEVKLTDFGIARALDAGGLTSPGTVKGKAGYMAPEQAVGGPVDARADVFGLGVILWELCAGRRLFARETEAATLRALTGDDRISPPSFWNEDVPAELDALVLGALERDPARRIATADELAEGLAEISLRVSRSAEDRDLRPLMRRLWPDESPSRATPAPAPRSRADVPGPDGEEGRGGEGSQDGERTVTWRPGGRLRRWAMGVAGAAVLAAGVAFAAWRGGRSPGPERPPVALREDPPVAAPVVAPRVPEPEPSPPSAADPARAPGVAGDAPPIPRRPLAPAPDPAPAPRPVVREVSDGLGGLEVPATASREGLLFVNTVPWAQIFVDGEPAGDTPRELRLAAGRHRVRLEHPTLGDAEEMVRVPAGKRVRLETSLKR